MGRLLLLAVLLGVVIATTYIVASALQGAWGRGQRVLAPVTKPQGAFLMESTGVQKVAYVALIVVMFGVTSGWLGGM